MTKPHRHREQLEEGQGVRWLDPWSREGRDGVREALGQRREV